MYTHYGLQGTQESKRSPDTLQEPRIQIPVFPGGSFSTQSALSQLGPSMGAVSNAQRLPGAVAEPGVTVGTGQGADVGCSAAPASG